MTIDELKLVYDLLSNGVGYYIYDIRKIDKVLTIIERELKLKEIENSPDYKLKDNK